MELARLETLLSRAAERKPSAALVRGEAGVGKSRLLREFVDRAIQYGAIILWGSAIPLGAGELAYAPLIDALRRLVRQSGESTLRETAGEDVYGELGDLVFDFVAQRPADQPSSRLHVFGAVLRLLDRLSASGRLAMVIEDLQWADTSTLDLIAYLTSALTDERLLLVCSYRSSNLPARHPVRMWVAELERGRRVECIELPRFSPAELRRLLEVTMGAIPHREVVERAFELSDGNAFFAEELVAAGVLDTVPVRLPNSLRDLLLARFELCGQEACEVMRVAATAGRGVSHGLLEQVCEMGGGRMLGALRECVAHQMLVVAPQGDGYLFRHALLREAVYQELLPGERKALHLAFARALAAEPGLSYAEERTVDAELSYHWYEAGVFEKALIAAVRAGDAAMKVRAFPEAERQYLRAVDVLARVGGASAGISRDRLLSSAAEAARWSGHVGRAVDLVREALLDVGTSRPERLGELYERLGSYAWEAGERADSEQAYAEAETLLTDRPSAVTARVLAGRATADLRAGRYSAGLLLSLDAADMARTVGARAEEGRALNTTGVAHAMLGRPEEGIEALRSALRIADETGHHEDLFRAFGNLTFALDLGGRLEEALSVAMAGLRRARESGFEHTRAAGVLANNASATLVRLGRWDEASEFISDVLVDRPPRESCYPRITLAEIEVARGRFDEAGALLASVRREGEQDAELVGHICACEAERATWLRDFETAGSAVSDGLAAIDGAENSAMALWLSALGIRVVADQRLRSATRSADRSERLRTTVENLWSAVTKLIEPGGPSALPDVLPLGLMCAAEHARWTGEAEPSMWADVAEKWTSLNRPYRAAYALWRQAEAAAAIHDPAQAVAAARAAHGVARGLGAEPLRLEIEALARRARLDLKAPGPVPSAKKARDPFGLTRREFDVLELLCHGRSNREIGRELFISEKTASVHVSNILAKLGADTRLEAAAVAHDTDLLEKRSK